MTVMTLNENSSAEVPEANSKLKYNKSSVSFLSVTAAKSSRAPVMHSHSICTKNMEKKRGWIPVRNAPGVMEYRKAPHHRQFSVGSAQRSDAVGKVNTYPQLKFPYVHSSMMQTSGISQVTSAKSVSGQTLLNCMQTQSGSSLLLKNNQNLFNQKTGTAKKSENISKSTKGTIILLREDVVRDSANAFQTVLQEQKSSSAWKTCPQKLTCVQKNSIKSNECSHSQLPCLHSVSHYTLDRSIDAELKESNLELNTAEVNKNENYSN
ncbi:uncharacterized protein LOC111085930 [Limulus polyphemus]|uniref:Uncharacterized protein LOC111085930 n=1 Tax=Limulus polyphemus TaxID=6850 RepID=A0ABM1SFX8_LIMPO|nr:uncharacterized protein LOC111085930 [Limulus polyphemus]